MQLVASNSTLLLERAQTIELLDATGVTAAVECGTLWITMDGDRRDIILGQGESWTVERNGRTLLHAEAPSRVRVTEPLPAAAEVPAATRGDFHDWVDRTFARTAVPYY